MIEKFFKDLENRRTKKKAEKIHLKKLRKSRDEAYANWRFSKFNYKDGCSTKEDVKKAEKKYLDKKEEYKKMKEGQKRRRRSSKIQKK